MALNNHARLAPCIGQVRESRHDNQAAIREKDQLPDEGQVRESRHDNQAAIREKGELQTSQVVCARSIDRGVVIGFPCLLAPAYGLAK